MSVCNAIEFSAPMLHLLLLSLPHLLSPKTSSFPASNDDDLIAFLVVKKKVTSWGKTVREFNITDSSARNGMKSNLWSHLLSADDSKSNGNQWHSMVTDDDASASSSFLLIAWHTGSRELTWVSLCCCDRLLSIVSHGLWNKLKTLRRICARSFLFMPASSSLIPDDDDLDDGRCGSGGGEWKSGIWFTSWQRIIFFISSGCCDCCCHTNFVFEGSTENRKEQFMHFYGDQHYHPLSNTRRREESEVSC